jgi:hypothetical protein
MTYAISALSREIKRLHSGRPAKNFSTLIVAHATTGRFARIVAAFCDAGIKRQGTRERGNKAPEKPRFIGLLTQSSDRELGAGS